MAEAATSSTTNSKDLTAGVSIKDNPIFRQLAVMLGIAASVALGVAVVMWSQTPNLAPLYGNLSEADAAEVLAVLQQSGAEYQVDPATGMVLVPAAKVKELRMQLASQGLPNSDGMGFELLQQDIGFGTSRVVEQARYQQAMQVELARTIGTIGAVQSARVHLAVPKQSVFVRDRKQPSASVTLRLHSGRKLEAQQVEAIVHLVASSVPELEPSRVTVVDHKGRLLSSNQGNDELQRSSTQFEFTKQVEQHYRERIEALLAPIVGADKVRAQVTADIDFTVTEQTQERYNPDQPALRSEQVNEEQRTAASTQGVPGALANTPPAAGAAPQQGNNAPGAAEDNGSRDSSRQATRNYELDRVISHSRMASNALRRLSVAVVVDDLVAVAEDGAVNRRERTAEEMERLTQLVREAIGFDVRRGDSVKVINSAFMAPEPVAALPEIAFWEETWFWDVLKQVGGVALVLLLIFGVLRPTMKRLTSPPAAEVPAGSALTATAPTSAAPLPPEVSAAGAAPGTSGVPATTLGAPQADPIRLPGGGEYENIMDAARQLVDEDPKRVAQLVRTWVTENAA